MKAQRRLAFPGVTRTFMSIVALGMLLLSGARTGFTPLCQHVTADAAERTLHAQAGHTRSSTTPGGHREPTAETPSSPTDNVMTVSPERLQAIGVKFEVVKRRPVDRSIRTVGQVEIDERRLAHVNIKLEGWIDELFVNSTGERVTKGQKLLTLYSPELVATQTEYLLALKSRRTLGGNAPSLR